MTDTFGATTIPLVASSTGDDVLLGYLASYFKAIANAHGNVAWAAISPGSPLPVKEAFTHDPRALSFNDRDTPALYLFRSGTDRRFNVAEDIRAEVSRLTLLWVPPPGDQERQRIRWRYPDRLFKLWDVYLERGRDPAWIVAGDTYYGASPALAPVVVDGTDPPAVTLTGTPTTAGWTFRLEITTGGARGTALFRWSTNDGATWTASGVLTAATVVLGATGVTAHFPTGLYATNNIFRAVVTAYGSVLFRWAKFRRLSLGAMARQPMNIPVEGGQPITYDAYAATLALEEELEPGTDLYDDLEGVSGQTVLATGDDFQTNQFLFDDDPG